MVIVKQRYGNQKCFKRYGTYLFKALTQRKRDFRCPLINGTR